MCVLVGVCFFPHLLCVARGSGRRKKKSITLHRRTPPHQEIPTCPTTVNPLCTVLIFVGVEVRARTWRFVRERIARADPQGSAFRPNHRGARKSAPPEPSTAIIIKAALRFYMTTADRCGFVFFYSTMSPTSPQSVYVADTVCVCAPKMNCDQGSRVKELLSVSCSCPVGPLLVVPSPSNPNVQTGTGC